MNYTNYIGMKFDGFTVVGYSIDEKCNSINLNIQCGNCKEYSNIKLKGNKIKVVKCKKCGKLCAIIPFKYDYENDMIKDTITIGEYKYRKWHKEFKSIEDTDITEIAFMLEKISNSK